MNSRQRVVRDVPAEKVEFVVAMMKADGAEVTKTSQGDGLWTITGVFPDGVATAVPATGRLEQDPAGPAITPTAGRTRDVDVLARTIWGEARGGSRLGMEAVAAVVLNRLREGKARRFGATIADVCLKPDQFSCWNPGDPNLAKLKAVDEADRQFLVCLKIARSAVDGGLVDPTEGSDHYHTVNVAPDWSRGKSFARRIDDHLFYNDIA